MAQNGAHRRCRTCSLAAVLPKQGGGLMILLGHQEQASKQTLMVSAPARRMPCLYFEHKSTWPYESQLRGTVH